MRRVSIIRSWKALLLTLAFAAAPWQAVDATTITFTNQPDWQAAVGGASNVTVFHFDGPTELHGRYSNDPLIVPSYSSQGVDFLPFRDTDVYPILARGQGHQIPDSSRDGLLGNSSSPNPRSDLIGRAIRFDFNITTNAVGVFTNRWPLEDPVGDGGYLQALDSSQAVIGQVDLGAGIFGGLITDVPIAHVIIVNTWDADILFGIWDLQFAKTLVPTAVLGARPNALRLYPNHPNPFSSQTAIAFELPEREAVSLRVFDAAGRLVATLVDRTFPAGSHRVEWRGYDSSGRRVPSGVYFYRLVAGSTTWTRKAILLK
jgi:hypothetical protein